MPPHCDSMDGPVVNAAREALAHADVKLVLPFVPESAEAEVTAAFERVAAVREHDATARDVADRWFFENVVRLHRAGEGAPYTGLKPAGLGHGPVVPIAEAAIESGSPDELERVLVEELRHQLRSRFEHLMELKAGANGDVAANRGYVESMLGLEVWAHGLHEAFGATPHEHAHSRPHSHG